MLVWSLSPWKGRFVRLKCNTSPNAFCWAQYTSLSLHSHIFCLSVTWFTWRTVFEHCKRDCCRMNVEPRSWLHKTSITLTSGSCQNVKRGCCVHGSLTSAHAWSCAFTSRLKRNYIRNSKNKQTNNNNIFPCLFSCLKWPWSQKSQLIHLTVRVDLISIHLQFLLHSVHLRSEMFNPLLLCY